MFPVQMPTDVMVFRVKSFSCTPPRPRPSRKRPSSPSPSPSAGASGDSSTGSTFFLPRDSFPNVTMQLLVAASPHQDPRNLITSFHQVLLCASAREVIETFVIGGDLFKLAFSLVDTAKVFPKLSSIHPLICALRRPGPGD